MTRTPHLNLAVGFGLLMVLLFSLSFGNQPNLVKGASSSDEVARPLQVQATAWYVALTGSDVSDCLTPETACRTITTALEKAAPGDSIYIGDGLYVENVVIRKSISLIGASPEATIIDGGGSGQVIDITSHLALEVNLSQLIIRNGRTHRRGAGIYNGTGNTLHIERSFIVDNHVLCSGECPPGEGGGVANRGHLTVSNSTISSNSIETEGHRAEGAGIHNYCCDLLSVAHVVILNSTISNNLVTSAHPGTYGGGIYNASSMEIINSSVSGNRAEYLDLGNYAAGRGGGIYNDGQLTIQSATITANQSSGAVGGLQNNAELVITSSIVAQNTGAIPDCGGESITSGGYNLIGDNSGCVFQSATGDQIGSSESPIDPLLAPLEDNLGHAWTHALLPGSPAFDAADPAYCPDSDQRGIDRPQVSRCDIGAYEVAMTHLDVSRITQGLELDLTGSVFYDGIAGKDTLARAQLFSLNKRPELRQVVDGKCRIQAITQYLYIPGIGPIYIPIVGPIEEIPIEPNPSAGRVNTARYGFFNGSQVFNCWVAGKSLPHAGDYRFEMEVAIAGQAEPYVFSLGTRRFLPAEDLRVLLYRWQRPTDDPDYRVWDAALDSTILGSMEEMQRMFPLRAGTGNIDFSGDGPYHGLRFMVYPDVFDCSTYIFDPNLTWEERFSVCDLYARADGDLAIRRLNATLKLWEEEDGRLRDRFDWGSILAASVSNNGGHSCNAPQRIAGSDNDGAMGDASIITHEIAHCMGVVSGESPHYDGGGHSSTGSIPFLLGAPLVNMRLRQDYTPAYSLMFPSVGWSFHTALEGWEWNFLRRTIIDMPRPARANGELAQPQAADSQAEVPLFLLKGLIDDEDSLSVFYSARIDDLPLERTPPISMGRYALVFLDDDGAELGRHSFEPDYSDPDGETRSITSLIFVVPLPEGSRSYQIQREGETIYSQAFSVARPIISRAVATPDVDGRVHVQWTASDPDSDSLAYSLYLELGPDQPPLLLTSGLKATSYVFNPAFAPATYEARFIVEASDGYHTTTARSNTFAIEAKAPLVTIVGLADSGEVVAGQPVHLIGMGYDYTDGVLPDEALAWVSNLDGTLAVGGQANAALSVGTHTVQLNGASSSGLSGGASVQLRVLEDSDGDGLPDEYETLHSCLSASVFDSDIDVDGDSLLPLGERAWGTDPCQVDTDGDGVNDGEEVRLGSDPLDDESIPLPDLLSVTPSRADLGACSDTTSASIEVQATPNLVWDVTASVDWLTASGGGTGDGTIAIVAQCAELGQGAYTGQLLVSAPGSQPRIVDVSLRVSADGPSPVVFVPVITDR